MDDLLHESLGRIADVIERGLEAVSKAVYDARSAVEPQSKSPSDKKALAKAWLCGVLSGGDLSASEIEARIPSDLFSLSTLNHMRAKSLCFESYKREQKTYWHLRKHSTLVRLSDGYRIRLDDKEDGGCTDE